MRKGRNTKKWAACLLALALLLPTAVPAGEARAEFTLPTDERFTHEGVEYVCRREYTGVLPSESYAWCVVGAVVPDGADTLEIPEVLDGRKVVRLDLLFQGVREKSGRDGAGNGIRCLVLPRYVEPWIREGGMKDLGIYSLDQLEEIRVSGGSGYLRARDGVLFDAGMKTLIEYPVNRRDDEYRMPSSVESCPGIMNRNLRRIVFSSNKKFRYASVSGRNLESVYLPDNVTEVRVSGVFVGCKKLRDIRWSRNLEKVGGFEMADRLTRLRLPDKVREIEADAFMRCRSLREVVLPAGLEEIGTMAFWNCENLERVSPLPGGLRKVYRSAFGKCGKLKRIPPLPESLAMLGEGAFSKAGNIIRKAPYLMSSRSSRLKGSGVDLMGLRYLAVVEVGNGRKRLYFSSLHVWELKPSARSVTLGVGKMEEVRIIPRIVLKDTYKRYPGGFRDGWRMKTGILSFSSSNPRVAKVAANGKVRGVRKGGATITVRMKTSNVSCKVRVRVR